MPIKVDVRVPVGAPIKEIAEFARRCEDAGFSGVGIIDHQHTGRDVFVALAAAAMHTSRIDLYPAVTNPVTRHPMVLASVAQTLQEIAPGRILMAVGSGFMSVRQINRTRATVADMRTAIAEMRRLLRGESVYPGMTEGKMLHVDDVPTPVYVTASGPKMTELAGEVGDGAMLMAGLHRGAVARAQEIISDGARKAGRNAEDLPLILVCGGRFDDDLDRARESARDLCYQWITDPLKAYWIEAAGIEVPPVSAAAEIPPDSLAQLCDATGLFGPPEHWVDRIEQVASEVSNARIFIQPTTTYDLPVEAVETFRTRVAPKLTTS